MCNVTELHGARESADHEENYETITTANSSPGYQELETPRR